MTQSTCSACEGLGYNKTPLHYLGWGDSARSFCRACKRGRERFEQWRRQPAQRSSVEQFKKQNVARALAHSCMGARLADLRMPTLIPFPSLCRTCVRYVRQWPTQGRRGRGLYFWGAAGTGKTHAVAVVVNELIHEHLVGTLFVNVAHVMGDAWPQTHSGRAQKTATLLEQMTQVELLVLDGLGEEQASTRGADLLYTVVDRRWRERKAMLVTSPLDLSQLAHRYRPQLASRLREACQVQRLTADFRRQRPVDLRGED